MFVVIGQIRYLLTVTEKFNGSYTPHRQSQTHWQASVRMLDKNQKYKLTLKNADPQLNVVMWHSGKMQNIWLKNHNKSESVKVENQKEKNYLYT